MAEIRIDYESPKQKRRSSNPDLAASNVLACCAMACFGALLVGWMLACVKNFNLNPVFCVATLFGSVSFSLISLANSWGRCKLAWLALAVVFGSILLFMMFLLLPGSGFAV
jgi:hypothetical protein